jgi:ABC-type anion transport system duplicated permease subunit
VRQIPLHLLQYALRVTVRVFDAIIASLLFTDVLAILAESLRDEPIIIPALNILHRCRASTLCSIIPLSAFRRA